MEAYAKRRKRYVLQGPDGADRADLQGHQVPHHKAKKFEVDKDDEAGLFHGRPPQTFHTQEVRQCPPHRDTLREVRTWGRWIRLTVGRHLGPRLLPSVRR